MGQTISISIRFIFLVLLQGLVLNNIDLFGFMNPYLYVLVIILFPQEMNPSLVLFLSLLLGLSVDLFTLTWGMHTSACVFTAFLRPYLLRFMAPRDGYPVGVVPGLSQMGLNWFLTYAILLITIHHTFLYFVEVFRFNEILRTLGKALASSVFTFVLVLLSEFLTYRPTRSL